MIRTRPLRKLYAEAYEHGRAGDPPDASHYCETGHTDILTWIRSAGWQAGHDRFEQIQRRLGGSTTTHADHQETTTA